MEYLNEDGFFVRYAGTVRLSSTDGLCAAYDCRLFLALSPLTLRTEAADYRLSFGDAVYLPPALPYCFTVEGEGELLAVNFDFSRAYAHRRAICAPVPLCSFDAERVMATAPAAFSSPLVARRDSRIARWLKELLGERRFPQAFSESMCSFLLGQALLLMYRKAVNKMTEKEEALVGRVVAYIEAHYAEPIDNESLARSLAYHPYYLNRVFKRITGETLHTALLRLRIEKASALLFTPHMTVSEVGMAVGFVNFAHFSKVFRRYMGQTPMEYRKAHPTV